MKILVATNDFPPKVGGANYYVSEIVRRFAGDEVTVLASSWPGSAAFDASYPHRVIRWPSRILLPTPALTAAISTLIRDERPDLLLFGASFPLALLGATMRRRHGVPYATFTHGLEVAAAAFAPGRAFLRHLFKTASVVSVVSLWMKAIIEPLTGPGTAMVVVPSGIDGLAFRPDVNTDVVRRRHELGSGPVVCCVSRLVARKGQDQIIRALPRLAQTWPQLRFLVVGAGPNERALRRLAEETGVAGRVRFAGEVSYTELPAYFRVGDVFAMPCRERFGGLETEALGAVYLQAAAVGRPCVGGAIGGAPEAVRHGQTGLVVDGRSVEAIGDAIAALLRDPDRAREMGETGAAWVHRDMTWDRVAANLRATLVKAVVSPGAPATPAAPQRSAAN
jgi:phosphatidyl-myo-inositol dimannoside synthase